MTTNIIVTTLAAFAWLVGSFSYWKSRKLEKELEEREKEMKRKIYEISILKELGERTGYSLDVQRIVDIITGTLEQLIKYSVVSYMLIEPEKIYFKAHLEEPVHKKFIVEIKDRMLKSLSALSDKEFTKEQVEEILSGAILSEDLEKSVRSFFNIPLVIGGKVVGVLTISNTKAGLYKEEEMTILYKITQQASQAVTRLQEVVEIEQRKLNSMVESMAEAVVMTDKDYRIVVANPAVKKIIGIDDKKENVTIFDFIDNLEGKFDIRGKLEESVEFDKIITLDNIMIRDRFFQIFVSPVKSGEGLTKGNILGGVVIFHDVTKEKEVEKMRDDFTSMMVHELRSPLVGIKAMAEGIKTDGFEDTNMCKDYGGFIYEASAQMLNLVNDLLDAAKLEAGKFAVHKESADIKKVIKKRLSFFESVAKDNKIKLKSQLDKNLSTKVEFDTMRVSQVLNNLISNSLKFTKERGVVTIQALSHKKGGDIHTEAKESGIEWMLHSEEKKLANKISDSLIIAVTDTGAGISGDHILQLFNKFKQFQTKVAKGDKKGTGLGLAIAKGIVEAHGGMIGVVSEEGIGSTFYFTLPV